MFGRSATAKLARSACSAAARRRCSSSLRAALSSHPAPPASPAARLSGVPYSPLGGGPNFLGFSLDKGLDRRQFHSSTPLSFRYNQINQAESTEMALDGIRGAMYAARQYKAETEHLMKALLEQKDGLARSIFAKAGVDNTSVLQATDEFISQQPKVILDTSGFRLGQNLITLFDNAKKFKKEFGDEFLSVEHLVLAFLSDKRFGQQLLKNLKLSEKELRDAVTAVRGSQSVIDQNPEGKYQALEKYGNDMTELAKRGKLDPVIGHDDEIRCCIQILSRRTKNNLVIIGELGVVKTAIAEGLAQCIVRGDVPEPLLNRKLIYLDMGLVFAGAKSRGDFEERLKAVLKEVSASNGQIILFIDQIPTIVGAGDTGEPMHARNFLKPLLGRRELRAYAGEEVTDLDIAEIVSKRTGIPISNLQHSVRDKSVHLEDVLHKRVVGQDIAVKSVADAIRRSRAGLSDPNRPIASFMFMGPTGVGKTELAKALAGYLFNTENALVRIDMSEYMEKHAVSRLVGALPGYVGYEEGGQLTEIVRRRPYSVVLFDAIEKAHQDVFNILLQLLDDGRITDSQGRIVSFTNSVVIMTSNAFSHFIVQTLRTTHGTEEALYELIKKETIKFAREIFHPELFNRIDEYIVFKSLKKTHINRIVEMQLDRLKESLKQKNIYLQYAPTAVELLGNLSSKFDCGAWPVKRAIQQLVENEIALTMLRGNFKEDDTIIVDVAQSLKHLPLDMQLTITKVKNIHLTDAPAT